MDIERAVTLYEIRISEDKIKYDYWVDIGRPLNIDGVLHSSPQAVAGFEGILYGLVSHFIAEQEKIPFVYKLKFKEPIGLDEGEKKTLERIVEMHNKIIKSNLARGWIKEALEFEEKK